MGILADRRGGHSGPSAASKPFGDSLRMPVSSDWFTNLRDRVLEGYDGPVSLHKGSLPRIMYLQRQDTSRRLTSEDHARLLVELEKIHNEGLAEVVIEHFGKEIGFADQVAKIATVDVS
jgi:hypothetical protein